MPVAAMFRPFALIVSLIAATPAAAIVGGSDVDDPAGARSYTVGVMTSVGEMCSGIVVARRLVLTAAHCLIRGEAVYVMALDPEFNPREFRAVRSWRNPRFRAGLLPLQQRGSDIGMIRLAAPLPPDMRPLPIASSIDALSQADELRISGFGVARYGDRASAGQLREAKLMPIGLGRAGTVNLYASESGNFGPSGVSACLGDSGGPVVVGSTDPVLVGVISWVGAQDSGQSCQGITVAAPTILSDVAARASGASVRTPRRSVRRLSQRHHSVQSRKK